MADYKDDPAYQEVRGQIKSSQRSMMGSAALMVGTLFGSAVLLAKNVSRVSNAIGALLGISVLVPNYYFIKNAIHAFRLESDFRTQYNAKQAIKEAAKEMQQENTPQQSPDVPKWQREVAAKVATSSSTEISR